MDFGLGSYGVGFPAGTLSTLSPCVLPIIPILLGSATASHRRQPLALAAGLAISYAVIGTAFAWAGSALNVNASLFRDVGALILGCLGLILMSASLQLRFASATSTIRNAGNNFIARLNSDSLWGQFAIGAVMGGVWSPCVGPTLGAALALASHGSHMPQVTLLMGLFGLGAAFSVVALASMSRGAMMKVRGRLMQSGQVGKAILGAFMLIIAAMILSGLDKSIEAWSFDASPDWLTHLTTGF